MDVSAHSHVSHTHRGATSLPWQTGARETLTGNDFPGTTTTPSELAEVIHPSPLCSGVDPCVPKRWPGSLGWTGPERTEKRCSLLKDCQNPAQPLRSLCHHCSCQGGDVFLALLSRLELPKQVKQRGRVKVWCLCQSWRRSDRFT